MMIRRLVYFLRWGHWPKKFRFPYGIPRVPTPTQRASVSLGRFQRGQIDYDEFLGEIGEIYRENG